MKWSAGWSPSFSPSKSFSSVPTLGANQPSTATFDLFVIVPDSDERPIDQMHRAYRCVSGLGMPVDVL